MDIERRQRPPWKPQRGELIRLPGTTLAVPEWAAFTVVMVFCLVLLIIALIAF
jgi:hypothetical protein